MTEIKNILCEFLDSIRDYEHESGKSIYEDERESMEFVEIFLKDKKQVLCEGLNQSAQVIFQNNKEKGFWDNERNVGELLMLVTSELGEAMEAHRKGKMTVKHQLDYFFASQDYSDKMDVFKENVKDTFEDEIADAVIRLLDLSAGLGIDLEKHINAKVQFNKSRERLHGKSY